MKAKRALISIGKAALYTLFFFCLQVAVTAVVSIGSVFFGSLYIIIENTVVHGGMFDEQILLDRITGGLQANAALIGMILSAALTFLFLFIFFTVRGKSFAHETGFSRIGWLELVGPLSLGFGLNILASLLLSLIPFPDAWSQAFESSSEVLNSGNAVLMFLSTVFAAPLVEELIFRGLVYTRLKRGVPRAAALLLSAAVFGFMHGTLVHLFYTIPLGILLAVLFDRYDSLWASIAMHFGFNFAAVLLGYVPFSWVMILIAVILTGIGTAMTAAERKIPPQTVCFSETADFGQVPENTAETDGEQKL